jgi:hypothetical protein
LIREVFNVICFVFNWSLVTLYQLVKVTDAHKNEQHNVDQAHFDGK